MVNPPNWSECADRIKKEREALRKKNEREFQELKQNRPSSLDIERIYEKCLTKKGSQMSGGEENLYTVVNKATSIISSVTGGEIKQIGKKEFFSSV